MSEFSISTIKNLGRDDARQYMTKYFVPLRNGNHAMLIKGEYVEISVKTLRDTYFKKIPKDIMKYYMEEYETIREISYKLNAPTFYEDYINLCPKMKHSYKPYNTFNTKLQNNVKTILDYIKEILSNHNEASYNFILKWLSNMIKGNKNNSCLYLRSGQGVGKSTIPLFIRNHVIGHKLSLETGSDPIRSRFNLILAGKLLVTLEELENFSANEWTQISTRLKRIITSPTINIEVKGQDAYEIENINNYILISNNDAIKDDEGRRYYILDLNNSRVGDRQYFDNIYKNCFNDETGEAFYSYLMEIDTNGFNPQDFPLTRAKSDSIVKRLDNTYLFLKERYLLMKLPIDSSLIDLYDEYTQYATSKSFKPVKKIDFTRKLKDININYYKSNSINKYKVSYSNLLEIAKQQKWLHDTDDFTEEPTATEPINYEALYLEQSQKIQELEATIATLQQKATTATDDFDEKLKSLMNKFENLPALNTAPAEPQPESFMDKVNRLIYDYPVTPPEIYYTTTDSDDDDEYESESEEEEAESDNEPEDMPDSDIAYITNISLLI